jgi:hypothetical protein
VRTPHNGVGPDLGRVLGGRAVTPLTASARNEVRALPVSHEQAQALRKLISSILGVLTILFLPLSLRAHDIYTSWTDSYVRTDRFELTLTLARASALRLIPDSNALPPITPENFAEYAPRLKAVARELFEITSNGKPLTHSSVDMKISGDADITFHLAYPRPDTGSLRFVAHYLFRLVDGHVGTLVVSHAVGKDLGWSPVSVDQPVFEIKIPASRPPKP